MSQEPQRRRLCATDTRPSDGGLALGEWAVPSAHIGSNVFRAAPGSGEGNLVVSDIEMAHRALADLGIAVSDIWHGPPFPVEARQPGIDPERTSYGSFCSFTDPDGNLWFVQEVTTRLPGRVE
jgi:hypothetical protein